MAKNENNILHKKKVREPLDYFVYFFTFATPLFELPQAVEIYSRHSAQDVSLWTWGFFCIDNLVWIIYALHKKIRPLVITSILYEIIELAILIGILTYR
ncbi:MAG TPA: hypothetical protein VLG16_00510 [Candidatus Saccharimonadales bacterium]|nr:hypothetical protein [Candidatus Saccharimonadales bacterium]